MRSELTPGGIAVQVEDDPAPGPHPPGCALVLEGFPRSANTFAALTFERVVPGTPFAHHDHHAASVLLGLGAGIPAIVLYRDPLDACASLCVYDPNTSPGQAVRRWLRFYRALRPVLGQVELVSFDQATSPALLEVLAKLGFLTRPLARAIDWPKLEREVLADIRSRSGLPPAGTPLSADQANIGLRQLAAPSRSRRHLLEQARAEVLEVPELAEALELYDVLADV